MDYEQLASDVVAQARAAGADAADVYLQTSTDFSVQVRHGEIETLTQAGSKSLGLRVFQDGRLGFASTSDFSPNALDHIVRSTIALAREADSRPENGLADLSNETPHGDLRIYDPEVEALSTTTKIALAKSCEAAAFAADSRITNSEGAGFSSGVTMTVLANSHGLCASFRSSGCSLYCQPLAEEDGKRQIDYEWSYRHAFAELEAPEAIGRAAALRVLRKLGARKAPTQNAPVIFERRVAARIWGGIVAAVNGDNVHKEMSFLKGSLGNSIAAPSVTLVDDGTLTGGAGSAPFDGEGSATRRNVILDRGVLTMFMYDSATARKVGGGARSTGNARRSSGSLPTIGPFNVFVAPGDLTPAEIIAAIPNGLFVTDMMGAGANTVTGDFSIGASGLWIENGEFAYPVEEVTIASTMVNMLQGIERIGNDLVFNSSIVSPTFQVAEMTISGL